MYAGLVANILLSGSGVVNFVGLLLSPQQSTDVVVPGSALNPVGHAVHTKAPLAAYVSAGHVTHAAGPDAFLNFPASHTTHGPTSGPEYPGLQEHAVTLMLPADELAFAGQLVHDALPFVDLYVPGGHALQLPLEAPVSGPVYPVLHEHPNMDRVVDDGTQFRSCTPAT